MHKISVSLSGHQTSVSLEQEFITELQRIAKDNQTSIASIISDIDANRIPNTNLSSAIRIWVLKNVHK